VVVLPVRSVRFLEIFKYFFYMRLAADLYARREGSSAMSKSQNASDASDSEESVTDTLSLRQEEA
jgi:hypothetical protein